FAGGLGLVACCDIAVTEQDTIFSVSEVRLGLVPSVISPYLIRAIGARMARRYFLTAERFSAAEAHRIGLVHEVAPAAGLDAKVEAIVAALLEGGPSSQARSKRLIAEVTDRPIEQAVIDITARTIAEARASDEAREGLAAFFEKRKPKWRGEGNTPSAPPNSPHPRAPTPQWGCAKTPDARAARGRFDKKSGVSL